MDNKLRSRKLWFAIAWNVYVVVAMAITLALGKEVSYIGTIITFAGTITAAYVGIQGYIDNKKEKE